MAVGVNEIDALVSYIYANCGKKVGNISRDREQLTLEIYGGLDDQQIERTVDNFTWIEGLEHSTTESVIFQIEYEE